MNSKLGGVLPSAMALNASLNQRLGTSQEPTMLTPSEQKLLRQVEEEVDEENAKPSPWRQEKLLALREELKECIRLRKEEIRSKLQLQVQIVQQIQIENYRMKLPAETDLSDGGNNPQDANQ